MNEGGLSIHGGIFTAIAAGYIFTVIKKVPFFKLADIAVIAVALAQGIGRVGCDVFGKPMTSIMPWGINYNGQILHPVQAYEFILDYVLFIFLWRRSYKKKFEGELFIIYLITFSAIRGIVEFFRINPMVWGPFSVSHILSLILIIAGLIVYKVILSRVIYSTDVNRENPMSIKRSIFYLSALISTSLLIFYIVQG